jgi:enterochelin esterase-like enzyme
VLIAFHGRGESLKGPTRGAQGWFDDYRLLAARDRLTLPPLNRDDFQRFVTAERLVEINHQLATDPYQDMVLVTPYLPDVLKKEQAFESQPKLAAFIADALVPQLRAQLPVREQFAVDGVSLGGRAALLVGFALPTLFRSIGTLQAAIDDSELDAFAELGREAFRQKPHLKLRLLTSDEDYYQAVNREFSAVLVRAGVAHELSVVSGTHSYEFNRGPGAVEMLLHHQRLLR